MPGISLEEMAEVRLMNRTDQKYVTNWEKLLRLLELARENYSVQDMQGARVASYATTYWDGEGAANMYRQHQTGHIPRSKVRVRTYVDSQISFLEIKKKDNHGRTCKSRVQVPSLTSVMENAVGQDFLYEQTGLSFSDLHPVVGNRFNRITLVNHARTERLTIDFGLRFHNYETRCDAAMGNVVVIELKRDGRAESPILPLLRSLRIRPLGFSKYCMGASVTDPSLRVNRFKKRLIRIRKIAQ